MGMPAMIVRPSSMVTKTSKITCPKCGYQAVEQMPTDACQYFYVCKGCGEKLKPEPGDCCVFCSYGDVPCPPVQEAREKNEPCYECQGIAKTNSARNLEWPSLPEYIVAALALLATGGVVCMLCL